MIRALIKKTSDITRFFILAAILFVVMAVALIGVSDYVVRQSFLTRVKNSTSRNIHTEAQSLLTAEDFSSGTTDRTNEVFTTLFQRIKTTEIFRIRVWDGQERVIFSDDTNVIGKSFSNDESYKKAILGEVVADYRSPDTSENLSVPGYGQIVSLYIPVTFDGSTRPVGVIETHFMLGNVNAQIRTTQILLIYTILLLVAISFLLLYVLLKVVVFRQSDLLRTVIDTNPGLIFVKDWNGKFTLVNKATADIYNTTVEKLVGKTDADFNPNKEEISKFLADDRKVMESGKSSPTIEEPVINVSSGEERWFQTVKVPILFGGIKHVLGVSTEITQRIKQEEKSRLQAAALESAENSVFITDPDGTIQWVNPAFTRLTGFSAAEAIGKTPRILKSGKQPHEYYENFWETILSGNPIQSEIINRRKDGSQFIVHQTVTPVKDNLGNVMQFVAIQEDVSDRKQVEKALRDSQYAIVNVLEDLQHEKAKDDATIASIGDGLVAVDNEGKVTLMNHVAEELLGVKMPDVKGTKITNLTLEDEAGNLISFEKRPTTIALSTGKTSKVSFFFVRKDKTRFPIAITATPIKLGEKTIGLVEIIRDITREKEIDRAKTEFVSLASHQLRTPLSTINWYTEMLLSGDAGALDEKQKEYLKEVYGGSKRMVDLVNSLLNVSRIETGSFGIEPQNVVIKELVDGVLADLASDLTDKKIRVETAYGGVVSVTADPKLLRMMIQNVLTNAVRYTPTDGVVRFQVTRRPEDILFTISDTGIGIPAGARDKIFTKLYRADNARSAQPNGNGLGLYMVKSILEHAGGRIWFESEEGKGSTFYVTIPLTGMKKKEGTKTLT